MNSLSPISPDYTILTSFVPKGVCSYTPPRIDSLSQIYSSCLNQPKGTLFFIDVDETTICSRFTLGSKRWREYIAKATQEIDLARISHTLSSDGLTDRSDVPRVCEKPGARTNWHDIFSYALAQKDSIRAVETMTCSFVKDLQKKYVVCGFTTRERNFWYGMSQEGVDQLTVEQLRSVEVDFDHGSLENTYFDLSIDPHYFKGIFFANTQFKGEYLSNLLQKTSHKIPKIIFIDDKIKQVSSVIKALTDLGIPNECYIYSAAEEKRPFDPLISNIQLYYFYQSGGQKIISNEEAASIAEDNRKNNFQKDADFYLRATLTDSHKFYLTK